MASRSRRRRVAAWRRPTLSEPTTPIFPNRMGTESANPLSSTKTTFPRCAEAEAETAASPAATASTLPPAPPTNSGQCRVRPVIQDGHIRCTCMCMWIYYCQYVEQRFWGERCPKFPGEALLLNLRECLCNFVCMDSRISWSTIVSSEYLSAKEAEGIKLYHVY